MSKKIKLPATDRLLGLAAMFVSLVTLFIFIRQTNIMDKESRLGVLPYLMLETSNDSENAVFRIEVHNYGVGPAIIEKRSILFKEKTYDMEFPEFLSEVFPEMDSISIINTSTLQPGLAIPAGQFRTVVVAGGSREGYQRFLKLMNKLQGDGNESGFDYRIQYKSIFDDSWMINAIDDEPVEVE